MFPADLDASVSGDVLAQAARGALAGSFGGQMDARQSGGRETVSQVELSDVSVLTRGRQPAYSGTFVGLDTDANRGRMARALLDRLTAAVA